MADKVHIKTNKDKQTAEWFVPLRKVIGEHLTTTSAPGLNNINRCKTFVGKLFWGCLVCFGFLIACIQITRLYDEYTEYPIRITLKYENNRSLEFPSVTICNLNPIRQSKLNEDAGLTAAAMGPLSDKPGQPHPPQPQPQPPQPPSSPQPPHFQPTEVKSTHRGSYSSTEMTTLKASSTKRHTDTSEVINVDRN